MTNLAINIIKRDITAINIMTDFRDTHTHAYIYIYIYIYVHQIWQELNTYMYSLNKGAPL